MKRLTILSIACVIIAGCVPAEDLEKANAQIAALESSVAVLQEDRSEAQTELANLRSDYADLEVENRNLSKLSRLVCDDEVEMKYENIFDASTIIAAWWARQSGVQSIQSTYRDHIWSNADTKIHGVNFTSSEDNQQYVEHFLIYFDEFAMKPGVFWVGGQCWLDTP